LSIFFFQKKNLKFEPSLKSHFINIFEEKIQIVVITSFRPIFEKVVADMSISDEALE
jgi:hypothetical protein